MQKNTVKIYFDLSSYGGVQTCVCALVSYLNDRNVRPQICWDTAPSNRVMEGLLFEYVPIKFKLPSKRIKKLPHVLRYWAWMINYKVIKDPADYHISFHAVVGLGAEVNGISYISGPPYLRSLHSNCLYSISSAIYEAGLYKVIPIYRINEGSKYVTNSRFISDLIYKEHGRALSVIYPPIQKPPKLKYVEKDIDVIYFGRLVSFKRVNIVLDVANEFKTLNVVIAGSVNQENKKYLNYLEKEVKTRGIRNVSFYLNLPYASAQELLARSRIYLFPAIEEHFGIVTVEAINLGCIPLVHNSGGQREIVRNDSFRFSDHELISKVNDVLSNYESYKEYWSNQDLSEFSGDYYGQELIRCLEENEDIS